MHTDDTDKITESVISCAIQVSNTLGVGFLEKVYENALVLEIRKTGLKADQQKKIQVRYDDVIIGDYVPIFMKARGLNVGLILNFGTPKVEVPRMVL